jgi:hypothetical protein
VALGFVDKPQEISTYGKTKHCGNCRESEARYDYTLNIEHTLANF